MSYHFNEIEARWQKYWADNQTFKAINPSDSPSQGGGPGEAPKYYVLDMFPYPSGAGLHVGHPLGYIASDIYARYKRHKGFNVMHPMGYDSFGLPAEQYAIQTGQHPKDTTEINIDGCLDDNGDVLKKYVNEDGSIKDEALIEKGKLTTIHDENYRDNVIKGYRKQLDKIGFSFDWSREVRTSDPKYYKWTQWIFIQLFNSWYNKDTDKAEDVATLVSIFEKEGNAKVNAEADDDVELFTAQQWKAFSSEEQQEILLQYRLTYLSETEVNWCSALGTVLANDEIVNGVSERGGHPVERKKMKQWSMRISAYAQRLLDGLNKIDWPQPLKDSQTNWIGRSEGAMVKFPILESKDLPPAPAEGGGTVPRYRTSNSKIYGTLLNRAKAMRKNPTPAEAKLWESLKNKNLDLKFRRQHPIFNYIVDFVCIEKRLIIEVDGEIHQYQLSEDAERQLLLEEKKGFKVLRFINEEVLNNIEEVLSKIKEELNSPSFGGGRGEVSSQLEIPVFTTRPDTIFGVSFMTLAPEHELVSKITTPEQKEEVEAYIKATAKRSELDRMSDVKTITGAFTGAYAEHPFTKEPIPIWIGDYVLAGYGTGAVMSVPCGDQRDYDFAKHFNIPIPNIFEGVDISEEAFSDKDKTVIANSDFLNGLPYKKAMKTIIYEIEKQGYGYKKVNYRMRDAVFSRQRYWGEPFPVYYVNGLPQMIDEKHLPIELPDVEKYLPTEDGKPPLGNAKEWYWLEQNGIGKTVSKKEFENSSPEGRLGGALELNTMPGWAGSSQYFNRYMDPHNENEIFSQEAINYWQDVDLYIGGSEHATGHLLYSRFWQKFMFDKGLVPKDEFAKKLINQGMILGTSAFVYRVQPFQVTKLATDIIDQKKSIFISQNLKEEIDFENQPNAYGSSVLKEKNLLIKELIKKQLTDNIENPSFGLVPVHVDVSFVNSSNELDIEAFRKWRPEYNDAVFVCEDGSVLSPALSKGKGAQSVNYLTGDVEFAAVNLERAKAMRADPTKAEALLWKELKGKKLGVKFRQQHLVEAYIVDFVCLSKQLIIEVDGDVHDNQKELDDERTLVLESKGYKVIRFNNEEVLSDIKTVLGKIETELQNFQGNEEVLPLGKDLGWDTPTESPFIVHREVEKMSKSKYNVVNPDAICEQYGADSLRMYEMFLGPLEQAKPWNTAGITGVHSFLKKLWKLYHTGENGAFYVTSSPPEGELEGASGEAFKVLHKTIKKVEEDIEDFSFNTSVSTFMIAVNELTAQKCTSRAILEPLLILISPYAPHIAEELWSKLGHNESISTAAFPKFEAKYLVESTKTYPISFNGKLRFTMDLSLDLTKEQIEEAVLAHEKTQSQLAGRTPKKIIIVPGKIVNIVG